MLFFIGLIVGVALGIILGMCIMCAMYVSKRSDEEKPDDYDKQ